MKAISQKESTLVIYSTPDSAEASNTYFLTVNRQPIFVEKYNSISYCHFAFVGQVDIEITVREKVHHYTLSPKRYEIFSSNFEDKIYFSLTNPTKLILHQVNSLHEKLFIIADPLEDKQPQLDSPNVINIMTYGVDSSGVNDATEKIQQAINDVANQQGILYFPPGLYKTQQLNLKSYMTLYLAGGAVLEATKDIYPSYGQGLLYLKNVNKVKIMGRGVLKGHGSYWRPRGGFYNLIEMSNVNTVIVEDIILHDASFANIWIEYSQKITIYNIKIFSDPNPYFVNTDGFDLWSSRNITIDNIVYKGTDSAISYGGDNRALIQNNENINIKNSVFDTCGAFTIGTSTYQDLICDINYENIDIIYANNFAELISPGKTKFNNIYFKNIRIENILNLQKHWQNHYLINLRIISDNAKDTSYSKNLNYIKDVYFYNLVIDELNGKNSTFQGYDSRQDISNINFDNFYIKNQCVTKIEDAYFSCVPSEKDKNNYVKLNFTHSSLTIVNITATKIWACPSGEPGEFVVTRTGNLNKPLMVRYSIRGTAKNGVDYQLIANFVSIPSGINKAEIIIKPHERGRNQELKSIFLSLENLPNSLQYILGPNFHAVMNILSHSDE
ncbi:MAG: glycosyl hydrolase family 28 protein [Nodularia sp. CChRGM 3473]